MEQLTMSKAERKKLEIMQRLGRGELSRSEAAGLLELSTRQVYRLLRRWKDLGDRGVIHRARGGHSGRSDLTTRNQVLVLYRQSYSDYGPKLFGEELFEQYGIRVHRETLRRWLTQASLWKPEEQGRRHRMHRKARPRKAALGMMLQLDGSTHDWFEGRNPALPKLTLLVLIDDASNQTLLRFSPTEDAQGVFELTRDYVHRYGLPRSIYTDHGTVYWTEPGKTQYGRALDELGVACIYARSPQAKGRVERANRTHQDRLIKAMRQRRIATIEQANRFLDEHYTPKHNAQFAQTKGLEDAHRSIKGYAIDRILSFQQERKIRNDYTVTVASKRWQIERPIPPERYLLPSPGATVIVRVYLDGSLHIFAGEQELRCRPVTEREAKTKGMLNLTGRPTAGGAAKHLFTKQVRAATAKQPLTLPTELDERHGQTLTLS